MFEANQNQLDKVHKYFYETKNGMFLPRAILVDTDSESINDLLEGPQARQIDQSNIYARSSNQSCVTYS